MSKTNYRGFDQMAIYLPSSYYRKPIRPRYEKRNFSKMSKQTFEYSAEKVWAAAAAANRINNGYEKFDLTDYDNEGNVVKNTVANKKMVGKMLNEDSGWTDDDIKVGAAAREYWIGILLKVIGGTANDFEKTAVELAQKEVITDFYGVAVISSLISSADRGRAIEQANTAKVSTDSVHVGKAGEQVILEGAEIISSVYNANFGKHRNEAIFKNNVFTWWGNSYNVGETIQVKGRVRDHIVDRNSNVQITRINYVREI